MELENIDPLPQSISSTTISLIFQTTESTLQQPTNLIALNSEFESINDEFDKQSDDEFDKQLELYEGQKFKTVEKAYITVKLFAHSNGFGIRKGHVEKDASGVHEISKSFLTKEILKDIEFYTLSGKINASAQYRLLLEKYKVPIHHSNLYNAITKIKRMASHGDNDEAELALYADRHSWARAYTFRHFTASAQATSHMQDDDDDDDAAFIDNAFDYPLAHSLVLFKQVEDKVVEVWEVIHMTWQHSQLLVFLLSDGSFICSSAKFSINFVAKCWLLEKYQDEDLGMQSLVNLSTVFLSELSEALAPMTILSSNESSSLFSVSNEMSTMTRLSSSVAINIAIEKDDLNVLKSLKTYILQNNCSLVENTTNASTSGHKTSILKEHSEPNVIIEKLSKAQDKQSKSVRGPRTNTCGEYSGKATSYELIESPPRSPLNEILTNISEKISAESYRYCGALFGSFRHAVFEHIFKSKISPTVNSESSEADIISWKSSEAYDGVKTITKKVQEDSSSSDSEQN
ncbi:23329_t:CDS:10 [Dentiscutata erythropus]|uniref:23329_t:CDS:1 n=1 Tax=Dentiscutata erythropus TaxID=1348616 RepID=A0A9N9GQQ0_9GLOM|nr:23329_t:CDS:10 [Dentiscutata erythropus]